MNNQYSLRTSLARAGWKAAMDDGKVRISKHISPSYEYQIYLNPDNTKGTIKQIWNYQFQDDDVEFSGDLVEYEKNLRFAENALQELKSGIKRDYEEWKKAL